jgi:hypothetical protein
MLVGRSRMIPGRLCPSCVHGPCRQRAAIASIYGPLSPGSGGRTGCVRAARPRRGDRRTQGVVPRVCSSDVRRPDPSQSRRGRPDRTVGGYSRDSHKLQPHVHSAAGCRWGHRTGWPDWQPDYWQAELFLLFADAPELLPLVSRPTSALASGSNCQLVARRCSPESANTRSQGDVRSQPRFQLHPVRPGR